MGKEKEGYPDLLYLAMGKEKEYNTDLPCLAMGKEKEYNIDLLCLAMGKEKESSAWLWEKTATQSCSVLPQGKNKEYLCQIIGGVKGNVFLLERMSVIK